jgi:hypothetical protein
MTMQADYPLSFRCEEPPLNVRERAQCEPKRRGFRTDNLPTGLLDQCCLGSPELSAIAESIATLNGQSGLLMRRSDSGYLAHSRSVDFPTSL